MRVSSRLEQAHPLLWPWLLGGLGLLALCAAAGTLYVSNGRALEVSENPPSRNPKPEPAAPVAAVPGTEKDLVQLQPITLPMREYEELKYDILWNGVPAGLARFRTKPPKPFMDASGPLVWPVQLEVRTNKVVNTFYPVNDRTRSMIDVQGGFSRFFLQEMDEGDYETRDRISFDYTMDHLSATCEHDRGKDNWRSIGVPLPGKVLDPLSALYYLRSTNLSLTQPVTLPVCAERRVWNVTLAPLGRETITLAGINENKPIDCLVVSMEFDFNGLFVRKGPLKVWLDEKTKIPLKIVTELPIGPCEIRLVKMGTYDH